MDQTIITDLLPSQQLKDAIRATDHRFTGRELVLMAEQYAPTRKQRLNALENIVAQCADSGVVKLAERLLDYHRDALEQMLLPEPDTVYIAEIREHPDSFLEHYPCRSFQAALHVIHGFCEEYAVALDDYSTVEIKKCRVLREDDDFDQFELGEISITKDLEIASADYWSLETNHFICPDGTMDFIRFPDILAPYGPVIFKNWRGRQYGMQVKSFRESDEDDAFVIYLDSESVNSEDLSNFGNAHCHVPIPRIEQIQPEQLPEKERANYFRLVEYLKSRSLI